MTKRQPFIKDRKMALWGGVALYLAGSVLIYDAYEHRGRERPFWTRFLSGGV